MKIASSREVYNCGLFRVTEDRAVDAKRGFRIKRSVVRHAGSAVMLAVDRRGRILLVDQYRTWKKLVSFLASPGYVEERMTIFLATDLTKGEATPMEDERIEAGWFTRRQVTAMIRTGKLEDGKTMLGFLIWQTGLGI